MTIRSSNGFIPHDYHMHSTLSCDCQASMAEMCQSALGRGIPEIAFTEHFDPKPEDICAGFYDPAGYFDALEAARRVFGPQGLTIRAGVEVGELHRYRAIVQPVLEAWPYDLVLGSLHWSGENNIFDDAQQAQPGAQAGWNEGNFDAAYAREVEERLGAADRAGLDLVAQKLVEVQAGAAAQGAAIQVAMPEHGREFRFRRELKNEPGGELLLAFRARRPGAWRAALGLWPLLPGFRLLWGLLRLALGPPNR